MRETELKLQCVISGGLSFEMYPGLTWDTDEVVDLMNVAALQQDGVNLTFREALVLVRDPDCPIARAIADGKLVPESIRIQRLAFASWKRRV